MFYQGRVQGVGFRYTAYSLARRSSVVGFVRNLSDGRVELVAEGPESDVELYLGQLAGRMKENIDRCDMDELPLDRSLSHFEIRH